MNFLFSQVPFLIRAKPFATSIFAIVANPIRKSYVLSFYAVKSKETIVAGRHQAGDNFGNELYR